jgi:uncharacterized paraquat-inducible protein A
MKNKKITFPEHKKVCSNCKFKWSPRVAEPKECPRCKVRLDLKVYVPKKFDKTPDKEYLAESAMERKNGY